MNRVPDASAEKVSGLAAALQRHGIALAAAVPFRPELTWPRVVDVARELGARTLVAGDGSRRVSDVVMCAQAVPGLLPLLRDGRLLLVPGDRHDVVIAACLAALNGVRLAGLLLTAGSAASAAVLGIEPRVAMISFSTGSSGVGLDVDKVTEATRIARQRRPDLAIDGPLQYDAAAVASVALSKRPGSLVAGRATVFVFPDLNTGNTTYKAVQRSADVVSIGPMLQGLAKPVNDLSRGALIEDIIYTIALTAIQAGAVRV